MNTIRRIFSVTIALILLLNVIPPVLAAEGDPGQLTMTASETAVSHGDSLTVTITANQSHDLLGAGITIAYDAAALEPVLEDCQTGTFTLSGPMTVGGRTVLRISSFPGVEGHAVKEDEPLAVLAFRTLTPGENIKVEMTAAYLYDADGNLLDLQTADPVQLSVAAVPVTGITLEMAELDLEIGESRTLAVNVQPENASDKTVTWTSSDETKVTVENGVLTGIAASEEPVTITASAGDFTAECTVTVVYPPDAGYIVTMPEDKTAVVGESITISPVIGNAEEVKVYNAYDLTLSYDPTMLLLTSTQLEDITVTTGEGTVHLIHYGPDIAIDTAPFSLTFQTLKTGEATVTVTAARVDHSENAVLSNAAKASLYPGETKITIGGYPVSLPDDFTGETVVEPGANYTFVARDKFYDYTFDGSTMGGQSVTVKDNGDGTFTVENVTGALVIQTQKTGKTFDVVLGTDMTGNSTARYMTEYTATLHEVDGYDYSVSITIGGVSYNGFTKTGDTYTIPGKDITGKIIFTVTKTATVPTPPSITYYDITFEGSGAGAAEGNAASIASGSSYSFTLNKEAGYRYSVTYQMGGGAETTIRPDEDGSYTIANVTADLIITVTRELDDQDYSVEIFEYITLQEGRTMYLVLVSGGLDDSRIFTYAESPMYYSEVYQAWCILTVEAETLTQETAKSVLSVQNGQMAAIGSAAYDVNMTGLVDINDAQLVYDMYNGKYQDFTTISMHKFLNADVNEDKKVTVSDAAAVVSAIK